MSNNSNTQWAEMLAEELEALQPYMNQYEYEDKLNDLIQMLKDGEFYEAQDFIYGLRDKYSGEIAERQYSDKLEAEAEYATNNYEER